MGPDETMQVALVAREHYINGKSRVDIADELGISRFKVARMLEIAVESHIVKFVIQAPSSVDVDLSTALRERYGLHRAFAVATPNDLSVNVREALGKVTADLLAEIVTADDVLGLASGRTLSAMIGHLDFLAPCDVVQLAGMAGPVGQTSNAVVREITDLSGGRPHSIYAPLIVSDAATAQSLRQQPSIHDAFSRFPTVTKAVLSAGSWVPPESQVYAGLMPDERNDLLNKGVRADVCATLLNEFGEEIPALQDRSLAISLEQMRAIPEVIVVAGGQQKTDALRAILRARFVTSLVTDARMAERLLDAP
ncbi:MAG: DNA-binding transcriptional regulator [Burkholderiaceae bacterium]|nr:DNA-binding transcriptional regulator [Microbacteriaceae bacterium]